jgi:hypothetical protein
VVSSKAVSNVESDVRQMLRVFEENEDPDACTRKMEVLMSGWDLDRRATATNTAQAIVADAKSAGWMGNLTSWMDQKPTPLGSRVSSVGLATGDPVVDKNGEVVGELRGQSGFARRTLRGFAPGRLEMAEFSKAKEEAGLPAEETKNLPPVGALPAKSETLAQRIAGAMFPHQSQEDLNRQVSEVLKGLSLEESKLVLRRVQTLIKSKEERVTGEMGKLQRTRQHADDVIKGMIDPYESPTPLMGRLFREHGADTAMDLMKDSLGPMKNGPGAGWEDRLSDVLVRNLRGKAKFQGRPATDDEIRNSMESADAALATMTSNQRAVYRLLITTAAGQAERGELESIDINNYFATAIWSEAAALRYWADPVWKEIAGSAQAYEARMTVIARLLKELSDRPDLDMGFSTAVFVILIWWQADERLPNSVAEETVHAVLQAGAQDGPSPWTQPTLAWCADWHQSAFARINVGHKLAALALTDVPAEVPHSPWKAWSLVVPDGMFTPTETVAGWDLVGHNQQHTKESLEVMLNRIPNREWTGVQIRRAWFHGTELIGLVADWTLITNDPSPELRCSAVSVGPASMAEAVGHDLVSMVRSLGLGVLAAITNQPARRAGSWGLTRKRPGSKKPDKLSVGEIWDVASPVTIDLRDHVRSIATGKTRARSAPTAAWVVRGHWKNQAHGEGRKLRKRIWIEPFWKGEESVRKLMRGVEVKED